MMYVALVGLLISGCDHKKDLDKGPIPKNTTQSQTQTKTKINTTAVQVDEKLGTPHDKEIALLYVSNTAQDGIKALLKIGDPSLESLKTVVEKSSSAVAKGWAIQAIAQINSPKSTELLKEIEKNTAIENLIRNWAAAALIQQCSTKEALLEHIDLIQTYPSLERPIGMKLERLEGGLNSLQALELIIKIPKLQSSLAPVILKSKPDILIEAMLTHADTNIRRQSASYLATMGRQNKSVVPALLKAYDFTPKAQEVIWKGGALYVPSIQWDKENGTALFAHLVSWYLFCEKNNLTSEKQQLYNNMRSVTLLGAIGMPRYLQQKTDFIIKEFSKVIGKKSMRAMLKEQGLLSKYKNLVGGQ